MDGGKRRGGRKTPQNKEISENVNEEIGVKPGNESKQKTPDKKSGQKRKANDDKMGLTDAKKGKKILEKQVDNNLTEEDQDFVDIPSEEVTNATFEEGNELVDMAVVQGNTDEENDQDAYLDGNESNTEDTENSDSEANDSEDRISVKYGRKSRS